MRSPSCAFGCPQQCAVCLAPLDELGSIVSSQESYRMETGKSEQPSLKETILERMAFRDTTETTYSDIGDSKESDNNQSKNDASTAQIMCPIGVWQDYEGYAHSASSIDRIISMVVQERIDSIDHLFSVLEEARGGITSDKLSDCTKRLASLALEWNAFKADIEAEQSIYAVNANLEMGRSTQRTGVNSTLELLGGHTDEWGGIRDLNEGLEDGGSKPGNPLPERISLPDDFDQGLASGISISEAQILVKDSQITPSPMNRFIPRFLVEWDAPEGPERWWVLRDTAHDAGEHCLSLTFYLRRHNKQSSQSRVEAIWNIKYFPIISDMSSSGKYSSLLFEMRYKLIPEEDLETRTWMAHALAMLDWPSEAEM